MLAYRNALVNFVSFAKVWRVPPTLPIAPQTLAIYIAHLSTRNFATATIRSAVSALAWHHRIRDLPDPSTPLYIKRMITGHKPQTTTKQEQFPIDRVLLHRLIDLLPLAIQAPYQRILLKALLLLMYHACMRVGEALVSNTADHTVKVDNVTIINSQPPAVSMVLNSYKHSSSPKSFIIQSADSTDYCPVAALIEYLKVRPPQKGLLFLAANGASVKRHYLSTNIKLLVAMAGHDASRYDTHGPRIGRTTDMARAGVPDHIIKETGRWESDAYKAYMRFGVFTLPR